MQPSTRTKGCALLALVTCVNLLVSLYRPASPYLHAEHEPAFVNAPKVSVYKLNGSTSSPSEDHDIIKNEINNSLTIDVREQKLINLPVLKGDEVLHYCQALEPFNNIFQNSFNASALEDETEILAMPDKAFSNPAFLEATMEPERIHILLLYPSLKPYFFCTLESMLRSIISDGPPVEIFVWISKLPSLNDPKVSNLIISVMELIQKTNRPVKVRFIELNFDKGVQGTPLEGFYRCMETLKGDLGKWESINRANALRLSLLRKFGGLYVDSDMLIIRDPTIGLNDGLAMQDSKSFNNAALKFSKKSETSGLLDLTMTEFVTGYRPRVWGWQGPLLFTRIITNPDICDLTEAKESRAFRLQLRFNFNCNDDNGRNFTIENWPRTQIYPIWWKSIADFNKTFDEVQSSLDISFANVNNTEFKDEAMMVHLWHEKLVPLETDLCNHTLGNKYTNTFIGRLRQDYCPYVFNIVRESCEL